MKRWKHEARQLGSRFVSAYDAFMDPVEVSDRSLFTTPEIVPRVPPGCRLERDEDGWTVWAGEVDLATAYSAEDAAEDAWVTYNAFDHPQPCAACSKESEPALPTVEGPTEIRIVE